MKRPWMPLYVGDYLADTAHLNAAESGVYLHLLMHYWLNEGLPDDDNLLARIARMPLNQWRKTRPLIEPFFSAGWKHKRVEFELTEAARISAAGRTGGKASAEARRQRSSNDRSTIISESLNDSTNDSSTIRQALHSPSQSKKDSGAYAPDADGPASDARTALFRDGLARMERLTGRPAQSCRPILGRWLRDANDDALRVGRLLEDAELNRVADPVAWITRALKPKPPALSEKETARKNWRDTLDQLGKYAAGSSGDHGAEIVRLLPAAGGREPSGSAGGDRGAV